MLVTTDFRSLLEVILFCLRVSQHMLLSSASWWRLKILVSAYHTHICELTNNISDIERTYGQKKLLAARFPLQQDQSLAQKRRLTQANHQRSVSTASAATDVSTLSTPAATEGETATETEEIDTETETEKKQKTLCEMCHKKSYGNTGRLDWIVVMGEKEIMKRNTER